MEGGDPPQKHHLGGPKGRAGSSQVKSQEGTSPVGGAAEGPRWGRGSLGSNLSQRKQGQAKETALAPGAGHSSIGLGYNDSPLLTLL